MLDPMRRKAAGDELMKIKRMMMQMIADHAASHGLDMMESSHEEESGESAAAEATEQAHGEEGMGSGPDMSHDALHGEENEDLQAAPMSAKDSIRQALLEHMRPKMKARRPGTAMMIAKVEEKPMKSKMMMPPKRGY